MTLTTKQAKGKTIEQICRQKTTRILDEHVLPSLSASVEAELERIMRRYILDFHFES